MWETVSFVAGMIVLLLLMAVLPYVFDFPEALGKYFGRYFRAKTRGAEMEKRIRKLEGRVNDLEDSLRSYEREQSTKRSS